MTTLSNILFLAAGTFWAVAAAAQATSFVQIEGTVKGTANGVPLKGILLTLPDGSGSFTNGLGHYTLLVPSGFIGSVIATDPCCSFSPAQTLGMHSYSNITADQINQDFTVGRLVLSVVQTSSGQPVSGVPLSSNDGQFATSGGGSFNFDFSNNGPLIVTPEYPGILFNPTSLSFLAPAASLLGGITATSGVQLPLFTTEPIPPGCFPPDFSNSFDGSTQRIYAWALLKATNYLTHLE
jgi:hypothetical protein